MFDPEDALREMRAIAAADLDSEDAHAQADALLCRILREAGYEDTVAVFEKLPKWHS